MTYKRLIVGDAGIVRTWQAAQVSRPQLVGVPLKSATCLDTLTSALSDVTDEYDFVIVSMLTSLLLEEGSAVDARRSCANIMADVFRIVVGAAKKSSRVEVIVCFYGFLLALIYL